MNNNDEREGYTDDPDAWLESQEDRLVKRAAIAALNVFAITLFVVIVVGLIIRGLLS